MEPIVGLCCLLLCLSLHCTEGVRGPAAGRTIVSCLCHQPHLGAVRCSRPFMTWSREQETKHLTSGKQLHLFSVAAIIKCHTPGGINNNLLFSPHLEARSLKSRCGSGYAASEGARGKGCFLPLPVSGGSSNPWRSSVCVSVSPVSAPASHHAVCVSPPLCIRAAVTLD